MRIDDFDSEWHFVPDRPEAIRGFRRTNRALILFFAVFVLGVFVAMLVSPPDRSFTTASKFSATAGHTAKALTPQHQEAPAPQNR